MKRNDSASTDRASGSGVSQVLLGLEDGLSIETVAKSGEEKQKKDGEEITEEGLIATRDCF